MRRYTWQKEPMRVLLGKTKAVRDPACSCPVKRLETDGRSTVPHCPPLYLRVKKSFSNTQIDHV